MVAQPRGSSWNSRLQLVPAMPPRPCVRWRVHHPPERETRLFLQAWHLARLAGLDPGSAALDPLGVVVDMHTEEGLDTVAGFADGSARYLGYSGAGVVWEVPDAIVGGLVQELLFRALDVVAMTGPLEGSRPGPPGHGGAMISVLTPGGIHVGAGSVYALSNDSRGGPVIAAAADLLRVLVERALEDRTLTGHLAVDTAT